ncbi:terminase [Fructobacillus tropaeoli]|uniref:terminase small subunit n=1 Tax=Fructobacillus tropaeoli TaxID=709323 RepID=UPI001455F1FF|nr:terminase small subunit [Fructobacillus tropaeoli]NLS38687.1 terminase [Fructobacillus tropaeoli]
MTKRDEAEKDYLAGMKYKDIANKYGVTINTVKSWRTRHWNKGAPPTEKRVHTKTEKGAHKKEVHPAIQELDESGLNYRQKRFVMEYVRLSNATQAYINAYDAEYNTARAEGSKTLAKPSIQKEIKRLRQDRLAELNIGVFDLLDDLAKEAKADIGNYVDFGSYDIAQKDFEDNPLLDADGNEIVDHRSWIQVKDKSKVDTSLIRKINKGKDGLVVELQDKNKARDKLLEYLREDGKIATETSKQRKERAEADIAAAKAKELQGAGDSQDDLLRSIADSLGDVE